jgi:hypothetical protein
VDSVADSPRTPATGTTSPFGPSRPRHSNRRRCPRSSERWPLIPCHLGRSRPCRARPGSGPCPPSRGRLGAPRVHPTPRSTQAADRIRRAPPRDLARAVTKDGPLTIKARTVGAPAPGDRGSPTVALIDESVPLRPPPIVRSLGAEPDVTGPCRRSYTGHWRGWYSFSQRSASSFISALVGSSSAVAAAS